MQEDLEQAIDEALDGRPRAAALVEMAEALQDRRDRLRTELRGATDDARAKELRTKLRDTERQLEVLREEHAITEFVEMSVKAAVLRAAPSPDQQQSLDLPGASSVPTGDDDY
jgi:hypothetical protein